MSMCNDSCPNSINVERKISSEKKKKNEIKRGEKKPEIQNKCRGWGQWYQVQGTCQLWDWLMLILSLYLLWFLTTSSILFSLFLLLLFTNPFFIFVYCSWYIQWIRSFGNICFITALKWPWNKSTACIASCRWVLSTRNSVKRRREEERVGKEIAKGHIMIINPQHYCALNTCLGEGWGNRYERERGWNKKATYPSWVQLRDHQPPALLRAPTRAEIGEREGVWQCVFEGRWWRSTMLRASTEGIPLVISPFFFSQFLFSIISITPLCTMMFWTCNIYPSFLKISN